jgi:hypothetical protein
MATKRTRQAHVPDEKLDAERLPILALKVVFARALCEHRFAYRPITDQHHSQLTR